MEQEIWRDIEGYKGLYQVSNMRRVKSLGNEFSRKEKILKPQKNTTGYLTIRLHKDGKQKGCLIHRLVAQTFLKNPEEYPVINHIDENKENNAVSNLEWCSVRYNNTYGNRIERVSKSKSVPVRCVETGEIFSSYKEAHEKTGIPACNIGSCARRDEYRYTARRYHWEHVKKGEN